jgi:hypothetical protein
MKEKYFEDFDFFWSKIENGENFTFSRFADGEVLLMEGKSVGMATQAFVSDKWMSDGGVKKISIDLIESLTYSDNNYYYAISSNTDSNHDFKFLYDRITNKKNITFANLWINANYKKHLDKINNLKRDVVLICNESGLSKSFPFKCIDIVPFPNDCVAFWEGDKYNFIEKIKNISLKYNDTLFLVCCGPASACINHILHNTNKNNTYIDFGSSLDTFIHSKITRDYMNDKSIYRDQISKF